MPTGYTADVADGKVTDFRTFALRCARAFGATVMQRDESLDVPPAPRVPNPYYTEERQKAEARIRELSEMAAADAARAAEASYRAALASHEEYIKASVATHERYRAMLAQVDAWTPPTAEHAPLKRFMREQIERSDTFGVYTPTAPERLSGAEWRAREMEHAARDLAYFTKQEREERDRCAGANAWIEALYASLPTTDSEVPA
jgi:hypothetical protein